jgi:hypothetical protein
MSVFIALKGAIPVASSQFPEKDRTRFCGIFINPFRCKVCNKSYQLPDASFQLKTSTKSLNRQIAKIKPV